MPGGFLPILGMIGSAVASAILAPKPPKAPDPAPAPPAPEAAPLPTPPAPPEAEPTIPPDAKMAMETDTANKRRRFISNVTTPLKEDTTRGNVQYKTLLGE